MPENIAVGFGQATFSLKHENIGKPFAVTLGVDLLAWQDDYLGAANALQILFGENIMPDVDNSVTLTHTDLYIGNGAQPSGSVRSNSVAVVGGTSMVSAPVNVAVLVNKQSALLGRAGRGRLFMPSNVKASDVSENGTIESGFRTALQSSWNDFYTALTETGTPEFHIPPVLLHQSGPLAGTATTITSFNVGAVVGTRGSRIR